MLCWYLKYVLHIVCSTFTVWELRARADGRPEIMHAGISVWHLSTCVYVRVSQLHLVPATSPPTSVPAPKPRTLWSEAWHRAGKSGKGSRAIFFPTASHQSNPCVLFLLVCPSPTLPYPLCQEQNPAEHPVEHSVHPWQASTRGAGGVPECLPGSVLCSGSLQHFSPCT